MDNVIDYRSQIQNATEYVKNRIQKLPNIGIILGSGLGDFGNLLNNRNIILTSEIPHYPELSVAAHEGELIIGDILTPYSPPITILAFKGRIHFYEYANLEYTMFPIALAHTLGVNQIILTNAAGGINKSFNIGDLMLITDYIDLTFLPLYSAVEKYLFKKESHTSIKNRNLFDSEMQSVLKSVASSFSIPLKEGVYCWLKGPSYETASEIRMFSRLGADAVGMSTVPEIYFAYMSGMKSIAISLISNLATGLSQTKLTHEEVTEAAEKVKHQFADLIIETIKRLDSR